MRSALVLAFLAAILALPRLALAELHIFTCEPEWEALATELGGGDVTVFGAARPLDNPHRVQFAPRLRAVAQRAELLVCTGAGLEAGWLPQLLHEINNPRIQKGQAGHFLAAEHVAILTSPASDGSSAGEAHRAANPHIQTDPRNIVAVADALANRLISLDPGEAEDYRFRHTAFITRWQVAMGGASGRAARHTRGDARYLVGLPGAMAGVGGSGHPGA
jgi:zinc/manganese transport system substrate-binding protein